MPRLVLQYEDRVLRDYVVDPGATIGRMPDNVIVIDNPAVSGHHARVFRDGDDFIVEDLRSTNGTFVNGRQVHRHTLRHDDVLLVGKHRLLFDCAETVAAQKGERALSDLHDTVFLDTAEHSAVLESLSAAWQARNATGVRETPEASTSLAGSAEVGVLKVLAGHVDQPEFRLEAPTSLIGRSESALVRLNGWLMPKKAVAIVRKGDGYVATPLEGRTLVNSQRLIGHRTLNDGDILEVSGLTLQFRKDG